MTTTDEDIDDNNNNHKSEDDDNDDNDEEQQQLHQQKQEQLLLLFASLLIKRIVKFLNHKPYDFAITILPSPSPPTSSSPSSSSSSSSPATASSQNRNKDAEDDDSLHLLTPEYRTLLETSIMLIREEEEEEDDNNTTDTTPTATAKSVKYHLGLEAQNLPFIARTIRNVYRTTKIKIKKAKAKVMKMKMKLNKKEEEPEVCDDDDINVLTLLLFNITSCLLLIQPDHSTIWSDRRRCLLLFQKKKQQQIIIIQQQQQQQQQKQKQNMKQTELLLLGNKNKNKNNKEQQQKKHCHYSDDESSSTEKEKKKKNKEDTMFTSLWYNELDYLDLLMTQHSKAPSSWAHRKYVLRQLLLLHTAHHHQQQQQQQMKMEVQSSYGNDEMISIIQDLVMKEVNGICSIVAEKYPKNYYAWTHRIYVVSELFILHGISSLENIKNKNNTDIHIHSTNSIDIDNIGNITNTISKSLETELKEKMYKEWLPAHPTDHSAINYTCQILNYLFYFLNPERYQYLKNAPPDMNTEKHLQPPPQPPPGLFLLFLEDLTKRRYELSILALDVVQKLLSRYPSNSNESIWILRRMTCQIIWKHSSSFITIPKTDDTPNYNHRYYDDYNNNSNATMRKLVRNDIKSVINSLNILNKTYSSEKEKTITSSFTSSQLGDGDDGKMITKNNISGNNIHAWTFLAWCIVNITNIDDVNDGCDDNTFFTQHIRETIMRRLQGVATPTTTITKTASNDGRADDAAEATTTTNTMAEHNTRMWTSSSSPDILLL